MTSQHPEPKRTSAERSRDERGREEAGPEGTSQAAWRAREPAPDEPPIVEEQDPELENSPVTAGLVMSVLTNERLAEVMQYYERNQEAVPEMGAARVLLGALKRDELTTVAARIGLPAHGRFFELLARLRFRCQ